MVSVDACHLKREYKGQLFGASCLHGQNEMFMLILAICKTENKENRTWLLGHLEFQLCSLLERNRIMCNRQKGLIEASLVAFINCQKVMCVTHLADNVVKNFRSHSSITSTLWQATLTYEYERFTQHMDKMKDIDERAY